VLPRFDIVIKYYRDLGFAVFANEQQHVSIRK
jgi:hypothetical protein